MFNERAALSGVPFSELKGTLLGHDLSKLTSCFTYGFVFFCTLERCLGI